MRKLKRLLFVLTVIITFFATGSQFVLAEAQNTQDNSTDNQSIQNKMKEDEIFTKTYGDYKDEKVYYNIDYMDLTELEEEAGFFDKFKLFSNMKDGAIGVIYNLLHEVFVTFPFFALKFFTSNLIYLLNIVYEVNFVNSIVDEIATYIQGVAGITGMSFGNTGLFGGFLGIITTTVALYTAYQFIVKKASITAFSGLLKSLAALVLALVFFSNYAPIIKGLNTLSVEASGLILSGSVSVNEKGTIDDKDSRERIVEEIWNTFVHQPYLMLQYGTMNESAIGSDRIETLLKTKTNTEERNNIVTEEIKKGNEMMTRGKMNERVGILLIAIFASLLNSIPILLLAFALLFFQFWFTAIAMIAPFVFIWAAFPNQFKVLGRFIAELITPLVLKLGVSILALIVFTLTGILSNISMEVANNSSLFGYVFLMFTEGILLFTLFLLRKRIMNIFSLGSQQLGYLRQEMSSAFVQPMKKGVQTTTTVLGTAVGAMAAGPQGAMIGASIGNSVGNGLTGDQDMESTVKHVALTSFLNGQNGSANENQEGIYPNQLKTSTVQSSSNPNTNQSSTPDQNLTSPEAQTSNTKTTPIETPQLVNLGDIGGRPVNQSRPVIIPNSEPISDDMQSYPIGNIESPENFESLIQQQPQILSADGPSILSNREEILPDDRHFELNDVISEINNDREDPSL